MYNKQEVSHMRVINGLNYSYKLKEMVKECYEKAMQHPLDRKSVV